MLNVQSLREQIYQYLRSEMQTGGIRPDSILNLNAISQNLGISKTPLRDALIKLETEGFVTIMPRRGVKVNPLTLTDVKNFYQIIGALEGEVVKEVFHRLGTAELEAMRRFTEKMRKALENDDFDAYYRGNIAFHDVFVNLSKNGSLRPLIMPMKRRLYDFQCRPYLKAWEMRNCREHDQFVDFIQAGDLAGAVHCLRDVHWSFEVQKEYICQYYNRSADEDETVQN